MTDDISIQYRYSNMIGRIPDLTYSLKVDGAISKRYVN